MKALRMVDDSDGEASRMSSILIGYFPDILQIVSEFAQIVPPLECFPPRIATSANGTKRKCHRRFATSAFGGLTDITIVVLEFAYDPIRKLEESME